MTNTKISFSMAITQSSQGCVEDKSPPLSSGKPSSAPVCTLQQAPWENITNLMFSMTLINIQYLSNVS